MKRTVMVFLCIALITSFCGCRQTDSAQNGTRVPEDFNIYFEFGVTNLNHFDTYDDVIQKDLVTPDRDVATAKLDVSEKQMTEIYKKLIQYDIASISTEMTAENLTTDGTISAVTPLTKYDIQFTINGARYRICGDDTAKHYTENEQAKNFVEFVQYMKEIYYNCPEYKTLPETESGYL